MKTEGDHKSVSDKRVREVCVWGGAMGDRQRCGVLQGLGALYFMAPVGIRKAAVDREVLWSTARTVCC